MIFEAFNKSKMYGNMKGEREFYSRQVWKESKKEIFEAISVFFCSITFCTDVRLS